MRYSLVDQNLTLGCFVDNFLAVIRFLCSLGLVRVSASSHLIMLPFFCK